MDISNWDNVITMALQEDIGWGDITTESTVPHGTQCEAFFLAKEDVVTCGLAAVERTFALLDKAVVFTQLVSDGDRVLAGGRIAELKGPARAILTGERTALNLLQRLSGIATRTRQCVDSVSATKTRILDTRKTTPGLRVLEKYAVRVGGGHNHRFGLSDGVLIKDNHIAAAGGIGMAVQRARSLAPHTLNIEVETSTLDEVRQALDAGADIIMLDNMSPDEMAEAVALIDGRALTEASGNMGDRQLGDIAALGVDLISIGALTHTVRAADISLKFV